MKPYLIILTLLILISCNSQEWVKQDQQAYLYPAYVLTYNEQLEPVDDIGYDLIPVKIIATTRALYFTDGDTQKNSCNKGSFAKIKLNNTIVIVHTKDLLIRTDIYNSNSANLLLLREYIEYDYESGCFNSFLLAMEDEHGVDLLQEDINESEDPPYIWIERNDGMIEEITRFTQQQNSYVATIHRGLQTANEVYKLNIFKKDGYWLAQRSDLISQGELDGMLDEKHTEFIPIEQEVKRLNILAYDNYRSNDFIERVANYIDYFKQQIKANPELITYPFSGLSESYGLHIAQAEDNNLKFYTWNTETGGSMKFFEGLYQTRKNETIKTHELEFGEGNAGYYVSKIHTIPSNYENYYVVIANQILSNEFIVQTAMAYKIGENNDLIPVKLFKTKSKAYHKIDIEYDFFSAMDEHDERPIEVIKYNEFSKTISFTLVNQNGSVTNKFLQYQWKGEAFEYIGIK